MDKSKQKKKYSQHNALVIKRLKEKYGLSTQYIHRSLRGDSSSETSTKICEDYKLMAAELDKALKKI